MNGPATDHFFRSGEWKRNPPFFVPTAPTTLPCLIERAISTTGDAGEDVDDVSRIDSRFRHGRSDEFLVHEAVHVRPAPARLVDDAIPDSREARFEGAEHRGDVRRLQEDLVLAVRVGTQRRRDPHEHPRAGDFLRRHVGNDPSPRTASTARRKAFGRRPRAGMRKALSRPSRSRGAMDTQDILDAALRLAKQSEIPSDTTINVPAKNVRRALFGIDVEAADLWMAKEKGYDVVIAHHPTGGSATLDFPKVLVKHADILARHGVPRPVADAAVREMQEDREQRAHAENYDRLPSIARLIGIGLMCIHNQCDEIGRRVMDETLRAKLKPNPRVRDAIDTLYTIPEFQAAKTRIAVRMGKIDSPLGKWAVHHGAGTNGGLPVARAAFEHGIDTVFYIHIDAGALRRLWELFGREGSKNLVVTGHVASDSIGINALVRELRTRGLRIDTYSGIVDV